MKRLRSLGMGVDRKQAEPLTVEEENSLWVCLEIAPLRHLSTHCSFCVACTLLLEFDKNIEVFKSRVVHHANVKNPQRCLVNLYKKYLQHQPKVEESALWYTKTPIGHNTVAKTVARVCQAGGVTGFKTNHSLHVTTATHLFHRGVDEQLIMARTGHHSIEGVRTYKRISEQQVKDISTLLNDATNGAPAAKMCKVTHDTEQETTTTNSLVPQASTAAHAGTCTVRSDQNCHKHTYSFSFSFHCMVALTLLST